jgi:hypothetical protein
MRSGRRGNGFRQRRQKAVVAAIASTKPARPTPRSQCNLCREQAPRSHDVKNYFSLMAERESGAAFLRNSNHA